MEEKDQLERSLLESSVLGGEDEEGLQTLVAAMYLRGAWFGLKRSELEVPRKTGGDRFWTRRARWLFKIRSPLARVTPALVWLYAALALFERPRWCAGSKKCGGGHLSHKYPNSRISGRVSSPVILLIRAGVLLCIALDVATARLAVYFAEKTSRRDERPRWWPLRYHNLAMKGLVVLCLVGDEVAIIFETAFRGWMWHRAATLTHVSLFLRTFLIVAYDRAVKTQIELMARCTPELVALMCLLGLAIAAYAWFGTLLWQDRTSEGRTIFRNFQEGVWQLYIAATTANFPDVMQRAYDASRVTVLFFLSYMIICLFCLMNLALAVVSDAYSKSMAARRKVASQNRKANLRLAYSLLESPKSGVDLGTFLRFIDDFGRLASTPHLDQVQARLVFAVLDDDGTGDIQQRAFESRLLDALRLRFEKVDEDSSAASESASDGGKSHHHKVIIRQTLKRRWRSVQRWCAGIFLTPMFEVFITVMLVANMVFEIVVEHDTIEGQDDDHDVRRRDGHPDTPAQILASCFTAIYLIEVIGKTIAHRGVWRYLTQSYTDAFDFVVTTASVAATIWVWWPNGFRDAFAIRITLLLRTLRLIRGISFVPVFRRTTASLALVVPRAVELFKSITLVAYVFAAVGLVLFGGRITKDPHSKHSRQIYHHAYDFATTADVGYYANSMNDVGSAIITLFELLTVPKSNFYPSLDFYFLTVWVVQL